MLSRTESSPDGSGVTLPEILRGACRRLKTMPPARRAMVALGASVSFVPQRPSRPEVTHGAATTGAGETTTRSPADATRPGLTAFATTAPGWAKVSVAV